MVPAEVSATARAQVSSVHGTLGYVRTSPETVVAVLLAAGSGSRFAAGRQGHKLDAHLPGNAVDPPETVIERALRHTIMAAIGSIIVVTGGWSPAHRGRIDGANADVSPGTDPHDMTDRPATDVPNGVDIPV